MEEALTDLEKIESTLNRLTKLSLDDYIDMKYYYLFLVQAYSITKFKRLAFENEFGFYLGEFMIRSLRFKVDNTASVYETYMLKEYQFQAINHVILEFIKNNSLYKLDNNTLKRIIRGLPFIKNVRHHEDVSNEDLFNFFTKDYFGNIDNWGLLSYARRSYHK